MVHQAPLLALFLPLSLAANCTPSTLQQYLPENAQVAFARAVAADGTFEVPAGDIAYPTSPTKLKALCAVEVNVTLSDNSAYSFGLFLPDDWNNRFLAVGNGGFAGGINWLAMAEGVGYGFASISTDTGHDSIPGDGSWAYQNEVARENWGFRALHGSIEIAKHVVSAYYGGQVQYSYYSGCSTGGRQGLKEVQLFPDDFDGVLAGAPAWWTSHLQTWTIKVAQNNLPITADYHIPPELFPAIDAEVIRQCDPQDGLKDGIISDPDGCNFFPETLLCRGPEDLSNQTAAGCLTAAQIGTLYKIHGDYVDVNQTFVFAGLALSSEAQWSTVLLGSTQPASLGYEYPQFFLDLGPQWNWTNFDYSIVQLADAQNPGDANADDFEKMEAFEKKGGKLLTYHGWSDGFIPTGSASVFYSSVLKALVPKGVDVDGFYRHFFVPGMQHCSGTPENVNAPWYFAGATQAGDVGSSPGSVHSVPGFEDAEHDVLLALMAWVEAGRAPESVVATKWVNDTRLEEGVLRQRPLCMFPKQAKYGGSGDPDEPGNWRCEDPWARGVVEQ